MDKKVEAKFRTCFCRQCGDEADPYSEAETFSVEETLTTSTSTAATTTSTRKVPPLRIFSPLGDEF
jgi:hypothetical protein